MKSAVIRFFTVMAVFHTALLACNVLNAQTVLNNDRLLIGTGSENSVNASGNLQQPFYYNSVYNLWRKLTFSNYPLDNAYAVDGDKTNEWNTNGTIVQNPVLTGQVVNTSGYVVLGPGRGYGTIISTGQISIAGKTMGIENTYTLAIDKSYIEVKVKVTNSSASTMENVRIWIGTRDDYVGGTDVPTKIKGNLVDGEFVKIPSADTRSAALKIVTGDEGVLFYTNSEKGNTITQSCCQWSNVIYQNPATAATEVTNDGSYGFYVRFIDLAPGASDEFTWYYAAGELADLEEIIQDVAEVSGAVSNITYTTATFRATSTLDATGYWMVVARNAAAPDAAQLKAGANYGSVTVVSHGSGAMTANVEKSFDITGLSAGTAYDLYFVSEDPSPAFSDVLKVQFSSASYTVPVVSATTDVSSITGNSAASGGTISDDGGQSVTARGVCWGTSSNPVIAGSFTTDGTGTGGFSSSLTGLTHSTTYYVRAYATNSVGTAYGPQISFATLTQTVPQLTTVEASTVTQTSASTGGNVTSDGGLEVTARGICWNTTGNPLVSDNYTSDGSGTGSFTSAMSALSPGTTYYLRAYATNSLGTGYGNQVSFITPKYPQTITFTELPLSTYGDGDITPEASASSGLDVSYSSSNTSVADIIDGKIHIAGAGVTSITASQNGDVNFNPAVDVVQTFTVAKKELTVTAENAEKIYGEENPSFNYSIEGFVNGDDTSSIDILPSCSTSAGVESNAGSHEITVSGASDNNYSFAYVAGNLLISPRTLTVTAEDAEKNYGDHNPSFTLSYTGFVNGDNEALLDMQPAGATTANEESAAGNYIITIEGGSDDNYSFEKISGTLTVHKRMITVVAEDVAKVYGDEIPELPYYYDGLVNGDTRSDINVAPETSTAAGRYSVTGYYDIRVSDAYDNNYDFFYEYGTLHVSPRALIVSAEDKNSVYGEVIPELTWVSEGFAEGEDESVLSSPVVILTTAGQGSDAGTYAITVGGAEATNYSLSFEAGTLTIDKATLAVTPENQTRPYAEDNPVLTFGYSGFVNGDDESVIDIKPHTSTVASKWTGTGQYAIVAGGGEDNNYDFEYDQAVITIVKADQEIDFDAIPSGLRAGSDIDLNASSTSGLPVTFAVSDPSKAGVQADILYLLNEGTITITATQAGDDNWNPVSVTSIVELLPFFDNSDYLMSPNGDGINDTWHIDYLEDYGNCTIRVFNRWGRRVFESSSYSNDWEGTFDGDLLPAGAYYFIIDSDNRGVVKGVINILY